jgi:hypothetical protein
MLYTEPYPQEQSKVGIWNLRTEFEIGLGSTSDVFWILWTRWILWWEGKLTGFEQCYKSPLSPQIFFSLLLLLFFLTIGFAMPPSPFSGSRTGWTCGLIRNGRNGLRKHRKLSQTFFRCTPIPL